MAAPKRTQRRTPTPPEIGKSLSMRILDQDLHDDLAVIMSTGCTASDAVRQAVALLAQTYRAAWDYGDVPRGTAPHILSARYALPDGRPSDVPVAAHTAFPHVREVPIRRAADQRV